MLGDSADETEMVASDDAVQYLRWGIGIVGQKPADSQLTVDWFGGTKESVADFVFFDHR